jgi:hypothetical protein
VRQEEEATAGLKALLQLRQTLLLTLEEAEEVDTAQELVELEAEELLCLEH